MDVLRLFKGTEKSIEQKRTTGPQLKFKKMLNFLLIFLWYKYISLYRIYLQPSIELANKSGNLM